MKPATLAPVYVMLWARMSEAARSCGYALAVHGTMSLDLDVVAIPWTAEAKSDEDVVRAMAEAVAERAGSDLVIGGPNHHAPHGRVRWSIPYSAEDGFTTAGYVDISVMPRASRASTGTDPGRDRELLIAATRALDLLANVEAGSEDEKLLWFREVQPVLDAARDYLMAPASPARAESDPGALAVLVKKADAAAIGAGWEAAYKALVRDLRSLSPGPDPREAAREALTIVAQLDAELRPDFPDDATYVVEVPAGATRRAREALRALSSPEDAT